MKVKEFTLPSGETALIDEEDFYLLEGYSYFLLSKGSSRTRCVYVGLTKREGNKSKHFALHRLILDAPDNMDVDHINSNGLDNRKENLRLCTQSQNNANSRIKKTNKSGYKGVSLTKAVNKWRATITKGYKQHSLGYYSDPREAAKAYNKKARELFGNYARLNKIKEDK